jgi:hypothetical protein
MGWDEKCWWLVFSTLGEEEALKLLFPFSDNCPTAISVYTVLV